VIKCLKKNDEKSDKIRLKNETQNQWGKNQYISSNITPDQQK
jgi:hypothetical protein